MRAILDGGSFVIRGANPKNIWSVPHCDIVGSTVGYPPDNSANAAFGCLSILWRCGLIRNDSAWSLQFNSSFWLELSRLRWIEAKTWNLEWLHLALKVSIRIKGCCKKIALYESIRGEQVSLSICPEKALQQRLASMFLFPGNNYSELVDVGSLGRLGCWVFEEIQYLHVLATSSIHPWKLIERFWVCRVSRMKDVPELLDQNNKGHIPSQDFHRSETSWCFETRWIIRLFVLGEFVTFPSDWLWWCLWKCVQKTGWNS